MHVDVAFLHLRAFLRDACKAVSAKDVPQDTDVMYRTSLARCYGAEFDWFHHECLSVSVVRSEKWQRQQLVSFSVFFVSVCLCTILFGKINLAVLFLNE